MMDIVEQIQLIELQLDTYQDTTDPVEKLDLKQTIQIGIGNIKNELKELPKDLQILILNNLKEIEEVFNY
jgi:hypothetical protein